MLASLAPISKPGIVLCELGGFVAPAALLATLAAASARVRLWSDGTVMMFPPPEALLVLGQEPSGQHRDACLRHLRRSGGPSLCASVAGGPAAHALRRGHFVDRSSDLRGRPTAAAEDSTATSETPAASVTRKVEVAGILRAIAVLSKRTRDFCWVKGVDKCSNCFFQTSSRMAYAPIPLSKEKRDGRSCAEGDRAGDPPVAPCVERTELCVQIELCCDEGGGLNRRTMRRWEERAHRPQGLFRRALCKFFDVGSVAELGLGDTFEAARW